MSSAGNPAETFLLEATELLAEVEQTVLDLEQHPADRESINHLFRAVHTIKGSGAMFGFENIAALTHHLETVLDRVRDGEAAVTKELIDVVLATRDQVRAMLEESAGGPPIDPARTEQIVTRLRAMGAQTSPGGSAATSDRFASSSARHMRAYRVRIQPHRDILAFGMDPALLLEDLRELGECAVYCHLEAVPDIDELDPEMCYLAWDVVLTSDAGPDAVRGVFIFVEDRCRIEIKEVGSDADLTSSDAVPCFGEILVDRGDIDHHAVQQALGQQKRLGQMLLDAGELTRDKMESALAEQKVLRDRVSLAHRETVRVPAAKLDTLINLVGELVIVQAQLSQTAVTLNSVDLTTPVEEVRRLTSELRDLVLNVRMMPIGSTFGRFRRLVRDLSAELGKEIALETSGAETELDKTVLDRLGDPLVHLIRNCIDHGIEPPEAREQRGKPRRGRIRLSAEHRGTNVVISVTDDGAGLDADALRGKAIERGLLAPDAQIDEHAAYQLIFAPGFSTARRVTNVSGRGVGMDVVKREIEALRGSIEIYSRSSQGTTVELYLPLTLAIIDGLLVEVGPERFVLPLGLVEKCLELDPASHALSTQRSLLSIDGGLVPYIRLRDVFAIPGAPSLQDTVVVQAGDARVGLIVDRVLGDHQTVIKPLGRMYRDSDCVSGATIMGDGRVALILDVPGLVRQARSQEIAATHCTSA